MFNWIKRIFTKKTIKMIPSTKPWIGCIPKEDFFKLSAEELIKLGFCPNCALEGRSLKYARESGCKTCYKCGWGLCG